MCRNVVEGQFTVLVDHVTNRNTRHCHFIYYPLLATKNNGPYNNDKRSLPTRLSALLCLMSPSLKDSAVND